MPEVRSTSVPVVRESLLLLSRRGAWRRRAWAALLAAAALLVPAVPARSASTGTTSLVTPQGSNAGTANGDYISSNSPAGLDEPYRYFVEVPAGASRLVIELFDADLGAGGATEDTAGRDRDRDNGYSSVVTYSLVNPAGATRTPEFTTGNTTTPTGADNAWLTFFDTTGDTVRDEFGTVSYANNDGTVDWAGDWDETNDNDDPADGQIRITGGELRLGDNGGAASTIHRDANLSGNGFSTASLTFNVRTTGVDNGDVFRLEISANGGTTWNLLEDLTGPIAATTRTYDVTPYIGTTTRVRFTEINGYGNNDFLFIDNLQIRETSVDAGHWELRVDQSDGGGDDINALGIRAHDGTSGAGGTELNVYYDSHNQYGVNPTAAGSGANSKTYEYFPYITSGCTAAKNDFDYDSNSGTVGSLAFASRTGAFTQTFASSSLSSNDTWRRDTINRWTTDTAATEYGIWSLDASINTYFTPAVNGNYANLYISNFQAAANPPTANPTANTFRVYLPTDAGAAPVKPYLEQLLTHKSGTNPVLVGQTSRWQVTVRLVNPTPHAITFSSPTNVVTARVPGSGAVYAGNAAVGQGSLTSQPAVGGTGDVVWNPGTLAAGATSILTYQVDISPTSAGQRILATSTPASGNGTRARFVDETGNTTQTRATYQAGPICELGVTEGLLTEAVIASFRARQEGNAVVLEWRTASESGTAGFYVYGRDLRDDTDTEPFQLHEHLLPGLLHAPQGGTYRFVDESASPRVPREYVLVEVEVDGRLRPHGPFRPAVEWGQSALESDLTYGRVAHPAQAAPVAKRARAAEAATAGSSKTLRVAVRESGLYRILSADMAGLFGISQSDMEKKVAEGKLSLTRGGQPVAWYPFFAGSAAAAPPTAQGAQGIYFYGQALDSLYSLDNVYRLDLGGSGLLMQVAAVSGPGAATPAASFAEVGRSERDLLPATAVAPDAESDYWFWDFLQAGDATYGRKTYNLDAPGLAAGASGTAASLTVRLFGATTTGVTGEHRVSVAVNGTPVGETSWQGIAPRSATFAVDPALLLETGNQVEVTALLDAGVPYSISYVDSFELGYPRSHRAAGDALAFTGTGAAVSVSGLSAAPVLLDVSVPARPRWLTGAAVEPDAAAGTGFRAGFAPAAAGVRYLAAGPGGVKTPVLRAWRDERLAASTHGADYLVITTAELRPAAQRLANYRAAQGLESLVVDVEAIYDEFNAGLPSPHALRSFLAQARRSWRKAPRYVVLAGAGSLDYRDLLGYGGGLVPPLLVRSSGGLFVSDNALADVTGGVGGDGLPEMAIGRLPVRTAAELNAYMDKLARAEAATVSGAPWRGHVLLLSDAPDRGAHFGADNEKVGARLPGGYSVDRIDLATEPAAAARSRLFAALAQGASLVNFLGHGGLDRLSGAGLLAGDDVPGLAGLPHGGRLPVFTAMTCTVNRFGVPGVSSLGELLVRQAGGGAAAVWSPSGLSIHGEAVLLAEHFYHQATNPAPATRLGDLVLRSLSDLKTLGGSRSMLDVYNLLGDPALLMQQPVPTPPAGGNGGGE